MNLLLVELRKTMVCLHKQAADETVVIIAQIQVRMTPAQNLSEFESKGGLFPGQCSTLPAAWN